MALMDEDRVVTVVRENAASLLRLARKHSLCDDDAADAYQRALEIYLERIERIDPATAGAWLRTVCKHEAMRLRAARQRVLTPEPVEWDARPSDDAADGQERAESLERVACAAEALQACRPDQARAMLLRADGSSYAEIAAQCGWTYSKVNRSLAEGRARFLRRFARIESGEACAGHLPALSAIVDGEASPDDFLAVRPHLRHCAGCRATLKAMYDAEPALGALVPAGAFVLAAPAAPGALARAMDSLSAEVGERLVRAHAVFEAATASKAAAVVASTAAVAAGGAAVEHVARASAHAPPPAAARVTHVRRAAVRLAAARVPAVTPTAAPSPEATPRVTPSPAPTATSTATPAATAAAPEFAAAEEGATRTSTAAPAARRSARGGGDGGEFAIEGVGRASGR